jgi:hypothetical protein
MVVFDLAFISMGAMPRATQLRTSVPNAAQHDLESDSGPGGSEFKSSLPTWQPGIEPPYHAHNVDHINFTPVRSLQKLGCSGLHPHKILVLRMSFEDWHSSE